MKRLSTILIIGLVFATGLFASPYYDTGSQIFSITAGPTVPLTFTSFKDDITQIGPGENGTHTTVGGYGSIAYQVFTNPYLALGGELGYQFNYALDSKIFTSVPMHFKMTVFPLQGKFELPIGLGLGMNYISYNGMSKLCMSAAMDLGFRFYFTEEWGMGIHSGISVIPEIYLTSDKKDFSALATFVPITLSVAYRH